MSYETSLHKAIAFCTLVLLFVGITFLLAVLASLRHVTTEHCQYQWTDDVRWVEMCETRSEVHLRWILTPKRRPLMDTIFG